MPRQIICVGDNTTRDELTTAIRELVTESRTIEALIDAAGEDTKRAQVYRTRWDSLAEKIETLCSEVLARKSNTISGQAVT